MFACKVKQNLIFLILQIIFLQKYVRHDIWIMAKDKMPIALDIKKIIVFPFEGLESRSDILDFLISLSKLNLSVLKKSNLPVGLL